MYSSYVLRYLLISSGVIFYSVGWYFPDIRQQTHFTGTWLIGISCLCLLINAVWAVYQRAAPEHASRDKLLYQQIRTGNVPKLFLAAISLTTIMLLAFFFFIIRVLYEMLAASGDSVVPNGLPTPAQGDISQGTPYGARNTLDTPLAVREMVWCIIFLVVLVFLSAMWGLRLAAHRLLTARERQNDTHFGVEGEPTTEYARNKMPV